MGIITAEDLTGQSTIAEVRRTGIGGSDVAALINRNPNKTAFDVWREKVEGYSAEENERMRRGKMLERVALAWYQQDEIEAKGIAQITYGNAPRMRSRDPRRDWWIGEPDGLVYDLERSPDLLSNASGIPGLLDAATGEVLSGPTPHHMVEAKTHGYYAGRGYGAEDSDDVPLVYLCQVTWYMGLFGLDRCDFAVISDTHEFRAYRVHLDANLLGELLIAAEEFWRDHVLTGKPPAPDGHKGRDEWIRKRWPSATDLVVRAEPATVELVHSLATRKARLKALEKEIDRDAQVVQEVMQGAAELLDPNGKVIASWKHNDRGNPNYKTALYQAAKLGGLTDDEIDRVIEQSRGTAARPFKVLAKAQ